MAIVKLKGESVETEGDFPKVGEKVKPFTLCDTELKDRSLSEFQGKRKLLSIVPSLDTQVCLTSTKKFNKIAYENDQISILVISADLPFAHKRICREEKTESVITLSCFRNPEFGVDYGVVMRTGPLKNLLSRAVIVLDENEKVLFAQHVEEISMEPHYEEPLSFLIKG